MADDPIRTLKRKTGIVTRTTKELLSYHEEVKQNQVKVDEVRASDDDSRLKQWEAVLAETQNMIPDTSSRLRVAVDDLQVVVDDSEGDEKDTPEYKAAVEALEAARSSLTVS